MKTIWSDEQERQIIQSIILSQSRIILSSRLSQKLPDHDDQKHQDKVWHQHKRSVLIKNFQNAWISFSVSTKCWACLLWVKVRKKTWAQKKENSNLWFGHFICPNQELFSLNQDWIIKKWGAQQHEKFWVSTVCYSILKQEYFVIKT